MDGLVEVLDVLECSLLTKLRYKEFALYIAQRA